MKVSVLTALMVICFVAFATNVTCISIDLDSIEVNFEDPNTVNEGAGAAVESIPPKSATPEKSPPASETSSEAPAESSTVAPDDSSYPVPQGSTSDAPEKSTTVTVEESTSFTPDEESTSAAPEETSSDAPEKSTSYVPNESASVPPENSSSAAPEDSTSDAPVDSSSAATDDTSSAGPEDTSSSPDEESTSAAPEESSSDAPEISTSAAPENSTSDAPGDSSSAATDDTTSAAPGDTSTDAPTKSTSAAPVESSAATPEELSTAVPEESSSADPEESSPAAPEHSAENSGSLEKSSEESFAPESRSFSPLSWLLKYILKTLRGINCTITGVFNVKVSSEEMIYNFQECGTETTKQMQDVLESVQKVISISNDIMNINANVCENPEYLSDVDCSQKASSQCVKELRSQILNLNSQLKSTNKLIKKVPADVGDCVTVTFLTYQQSITGFSKFIETCANCK